MTISELKSKKSETIKETRAIVKQAQAENRDMTKEEQELFDNNLIEIENLKAQISQLQDKLLEVATETKAEEPKDEPKEEPKEEETVEEPKEETPNEDTTEEAQEEEEKSEKTDNKEEEKTDNSTEETPEEETENEDSEEEEINNKTKRNHINMKTFITKEIRSALENGTKKFNLNAETRAIQVTGSNGVHDSVIEEIVPGLLEGLYSKSIIKDLGVRMYGGLPLQDLRFPALGKGTAGWVGEVTAAGATNNTFSSVLLQPKRITAYMDISKELIVQDTIGVEDALRRDIYNALVSKVQETFLSADAATTTKPAGIFNGITATNITSYEDLCDAEAKVDDSNVGGEKKYLMSNKAKAIVRSMAKSALTNELVLTNNNIDGTEVIANSQVPTTMYAFGNFDNIVFAQFGDIEVVVDEYTQAINGCVRLVINAYFDWKKVRADQDVLVYGTVSRPAANNG